jgi:twitching motility two-component system response regulator PilH
MAGNSVLVVDDSNTDRELAVHALAASGYRASSVGDAEECLKSVQTKHPDVIVLDIILPKQNGYQVCRQLKQDPATKDIKIILLSSKNQVSDKFWGMKQGADLYLTKPFEDDELVKGVRSLVGV